MNSKRNEHEVAPIRALSDSEANKEFFRTEPGKFVYHTTRPEFVIQIRRDPWMRVRRRDFTERT
ncbi:hypothetical protein GCM10007362_27110 [Saccharibacillus endophyticus]|uniref:KTSC domain-containing protein n=1 Tax=Saccharibacillus endophyticus TaxID=2060666 RepID=A0ABQ1ZY01_9BACL|nr:hypothetical protein GCM10007362_27110 [Saccharibacillus endophyticus]